MWICSAALGAERIICSYNIFSPIIVAEVWLENVKSGLVQLKSSPLRSLLILKSGIGCLNRLTNYILSSLIPSLPLFFSCSLSLPLPPSLSLSLSPCLSLFQMKWGMCIEYLNKLKGLLKKKFLTLLATSLGDPKSFALHDLIQVSLRPLFEGQHAEKEALCHQLICSIIHCFLCPISFPSVSLPLCPSFYLMNTIYLSLQ